MSHERRNAWSILCYDTPRARRSLWQSSHRRRVQRQGDGSVGVGSGQDPDPVAPDFPIAYTKGPLFDNEDKDLQVSAPTCATSCASTVGTDLYVRDRASPTAAERNVTLRAHQGYGRRHRASRSRSDGKKVLFAMRGPFDPKV